MAIIADIGDSLFGAADLTVHHNNHFMSPAFYTSMGSAIPGALGVQTAMPDVRPIVIVGDGAFQMSCLELSTIVERGLNPIVFVLNNDGYTTERFLLDGDFNNIRSWNYHNVTELINGGQQVVCENEDVLYEGVQKALDSKELFVLNVKVARDDISEGLSRMTTVLSKKI
jgi:indolepyruvate decarboxylase